MLSKSQRRDAFSELFADYYPMVFNAVYPKVGSRDDTEDICQEVFIAFYNHFEEVENVRAWLYGTLKNMVLKYYRDKRPSHENIDGIMDDVALSFVNGFRDTRIIISEIIEEVIVTEEEKNILELVAFHNYSYSEAAKLMGITKRKVDYNFNKIASKIVLRLQKRGLKHIEDLL